MLFLLAGIEFLQKFEGLTLPAVISVTSAPINFYSVVLSTVPFVVQHSGITEKVDNFTAESLDNFDRNRWTTWNGTGGQLQTEWLDNIERNTQVI
jgi:hypothetical protein